MSDVLTIAEAGLRLKKSYNQVLRLVMLGELRGSQDRQGRWSVSEGAVREFQERQQESTPV